MVNEPSKPLIILVSNQAYNKKLPLVAAWFSCYILPMVAGITGASGAIPVDDEKRRNSHARRFYEEVRKRTSDIKSIARNTGWEETKIERIKHHIFFALHDLGYDEPVPFDPDYNMAVSWQRLTDGADIQKEDYLLLEHEHLELSIMENEGLKYNEAHIKASKQFDYAAAIRRKEEEK